MFGKKSGKEDKVGELEKSLGKKVVELDRAAVESEMFVEEAKKKVLAEVERVLEGK